MTELQQLVRAAKRLTLENALLFRMRAAGLPEPEREVRVCAERRWRFDFAYSEQKLAIEVEGGSWVSGAHQRGKHFESDCEKYSEAAIRGWMLIRVTTDMITDGRAVRLIERALEARENQCQTIKK